MSAPAPKWKRERPLDIKRMTSSLMGSPDAPFWVTPLQIVGAILVGKLSDEISWTIILIAALVVIFAVKWYRERHAKRNREEVPELVEKPPSGKDGLILPLSPVALLGGRPEERDRLNGLLEDMRDPEYRLKPADLALLERSNLQSPFRSLEYHFTAQTLRECWLITTEDHEYPDGTTERGSWYSIDILKKWFFEKYPEAPQRIKFHHGPEWRIRPRDYGRLWLAIDTIFEQASFKAQNVIMDITPGNKPMTVAMALACLEPKRTMQYIVTGRDPLTGEVLSGSRREPVLIDIHPYLYSKETAQT